MAGILGYPNCIKVRAGIVNISSDKWHRKGNYQNFHLFFLFPGASMAF